MITPPESIRSFVGGGDFDEMGLTYRRLLIELIGLKPTHRLLDVGCGIGRMAIKLTDYLTDGEYCGFDVRREAIAWCQSNITKHSPHFRFAVFDIYNGRFNPNGTIRPVDFVFPYPDDYFDGVLLASIFTHMLPSDVQNYLNEIARVLNDSGRALITWFLMDDETMEAMKQSNWTGRKFLYQCDDCLTSDPKTPESAIAHPEASAFVMIDRAGLKIDHPIRYGKWRCGVFGLVHQDLITISKG